MKKVLSRNVLINKFRKLGFDGPYSGTKHQFMKKGDLKVRIPNPHSSKEIHISLVKEILKQAGLNEKEFDEM